MLATEDMQYLYGGSLNVKGYGFGAPRVVWGFLPKEIKERLSRFYTVRNIPDLVTHVPPALLGFRRGGELVRIGERGKYSPLNAHRASSYLNELREGSP